MNGTDIKPLIHIWFWSAKGIVYCYRWCWCHKEKKYIHTQTWLYYEHSLLYDVLCWISKTYLKVKKCTIDDITCFYAIEYRKMCIFFSVQLADYVICHSVSIKMLTRILLWLFISLYLHKKVHFHDWSITNFSFICSCHIRISFWT